MPNNEFPHAVPVLADSEQAWLVARRSFIGASESPVLLGVGYKGTSPLAIWQSKVLGGESTAGDLRMRIGKMKEPIIRELVAEALGQQVFVPRCMALRSESHPFIGASLDAEIDHQEFGRCPVELKNIGSHAAGEWEDGEPPPLKYAVQVQHQLLVTGARMGFLAGLIADERLVVKQVERDEAFIAALIQTLAEFWQHVTAREMPPADDSEATARALAAIYPRDDGSTIILPVEATSLIAAREEAAAKIKDAEAAKMAADNALKAMLGEHTTGELPDGRRVTWKVQETKGYTVEPRINRVLRVLKGK